jgi:hypothetical protein
MLIYGLVYLLYSCWNYYLFKNKVINYVNVLVFTIFDKPISFNQCLKSPELRNSLTDAEFTFTPLQIINYG